MHSLLPVLPALDGMFYIGMLRALVPATEQKHDAPAIQRVVNTVAWAHIDAKLPYTTATRFMISETTRGESDETTIHRNAGAYVAQFCTPG